MSQRIKVLWKSGAAFAALLLAVSLWIVAYNGRTQTQQYLTLAEAYTTAFSDRAALYLSRGDPQDLTLLANTASTLLFGDVILYVQVVSEGEVVVDVRATAGDALPLTRVMPERSARSHVLRLQDGTPYVDVTKVLFPIKRKDREPVSGYVRIGTTLNQLQAELLGNRLGTAGVALGVWLALLGALWWGTRVTPSLVEDGPGVPAVPVAVPLGENNDTPTTSLTAIHRVGTLSLDDTRKRVQVRGQPVELSPKEFELLTLLCQQPGKVFSNEEILKNIWPEQGFATAQDVKQYIYFLRRKLEQNPKQPQLIVTVRGFGYKLDSDPPTER